MITLRKPLLLSVVLSVLVSQAFPARTARASEETAPAVPISVKGPGYRLPFEFRKPFADEAERNDYLFFVREQIPFLFQETPDYSETFETLFENEDNLIKALRNNRTFKAQSEKYRGPLQEISVDLLDQAPAKSQTRLTDEGREFFRRAREKGALPIDGAAIEALAGRNPIGMRTGLALSLPPEARKDGFRLKGREQLEYFRANLSEEAFRASFRGAQYGFDQSQVTLSDVLGTIETLEGRLESLQEQVASYLLEKDPALAEGEVRVESVLSPKAIDDQANELASRLGVQGKEGKQALRTALQQIVQRYAAQEAVAGKSVRASIKLKEMPPHLAVYRGFIGGDCSTSNSFGFPYSPLERVYFIYDDVGQLRGYVGATIVRRDGKNVLYVHDVTGKYLSIEQLRMAVYGLKQRVAEIGVTDVVIAAAQRLRSNMHFGALINALVEMSAPEEAPLVHIDKGLRKLIVSKGSSASYDSPEGNNRGHAVLEGDPMEKQIEASVRSIQAPVFDRARYAKPSKISAVQLYSGLQGTGDSGGDEILARAGVNQKESSAFFNTLANTTMSSLRAFYGKVTKAVARFGGGQADIEGDLRHLIREGHARAKGFGRDVDPKERSRWEKLIIDEAVRQILDTDNGSTNALLRWYPQMKERFLSSQRFLDAVWRQFVESGEFSELLFEFEHDPKHEIARALESKIPEAIRRASDPNESNRYTYYEYFAKMAEIGNKAASEALKAHLMTEAPGRFELLQGIANRDEAALQPLSDAIRKAPKLGIEDTIASKGDANAAYLMGAARIARLGNQEAIEYGKRVLPRSSNTSDGFAVHLTRDWSKATPEARQAFESDRGFQNWVLRTLVDPAAKYDLAITAAVSPIDALLERREEVFSRHLEKAADPARKGDPRVLSALYRLGALARDQAFLEKVEALRRAAPIQVRLAALKEAKTAFTGPMEWHERSTLESLFEARASKVSAPARKTVAAKRAKVASRRR